MSRRTQVVRLLLSLWAESGFEQEVRAGTPGDPAYPRSRWPTTSRRAPRSTRCWPRPGQPAPRSPAPRRGREWGGYTGYFVDPDGVHWEIAWNPGPIGQLVLP